MVPHGFTISPLLTHTRLHSREAGSDGAGHAVGEGPTPGPREGTKRKRYVYRVSYPPITTGLLVILDVRSKKHKKTNDSNNSGEGNTSEYGSQPYQ